MFIPQHCFLVLSQFFSNNVHGLGWQTRHDELIYLNKECHKVLRHETL